MVDSVKNYGITGVGSTVELGKKGNKIVGTSAKVSLTENNGTTLLRANIADGTLAEHAVTKSQLDASVLQKVTATSVTVNYNDTNVVIGKLSGNATVLSTTVAPVTNWTSANDSTNIVVGDTTDADRLFTSFDPSTQSVDETNVEYSSAGVLSATVTQGGASAGSAKVTVLHSGVIDTSPSSVTVDYLIVGGGGGGGNGYDTGAGGGGAGGMVLQSNTSAYNDVTYSISVGSGGTGGADTRSNNNGTAGGNSSAFGLTALGGSAGNGSRTVSRGHGDGGDAASDPNTAAQGGDGGGNAGSATGGSSGGGGGATGAGGNGSSGTGGTGGAGEASSITGSSVTYGTGGAGAPGNTANYDGAAGGANTGTGGGGGSGVSANSGAGGNGGSGVVIIRYPDSNSAATTTGSVTATTSGGYRIYTFTGDGTFAL